MQTISTIRDANGLVNRLASIGDVAVYILIALAVIYIIYATVQYFIKGKEGESRGAAGMQIAWGIIGLAIILSLWGLVAILLNTFGTDNRVPRDRFPNANFVNNANNGNNTTYSTYNPETDFGQD